MIKPQMIVAVIIHSLMALSFLGDPDYSFLSYLVGAIVLCNIIGIVLITTNKKILGAKIFMISSAILVPIGLIGAIGARKIIDEEKKKNFYNQ
ncbi:hypothetical protein QUH73_19810 [Labilibaculum sp. K2S]|uniref:hypothetical protein n=1 Tax=Labilibaculum sp. K2S TaxID=3056386 RepID=UPI0025A3983F|nr:hypothetical protein [Labilibaculum sp. K2S]MDM8162074.1 hypothetical protein [Labilibaculum sp. K2S]